MVGAGAVGNEVIKNLVLLGVGEIDVFDFDVVELHNLTRSVLLREADTGRNKAEAVAGRARELDPQVTVRSIAGDFWDTLSLGHLQDYDCVIAAVDNLEARLKLNQMCLIAGVDLVNAGLDSRWVTVESFPFGSAACMACYECTLPDSAYARVAERYSCGGLRRRAQLERRIPTTVVTASVAGALAASTALRLGGSEAPAQSRRILIDTIGGSSSVVEIDRRDGCPGCAAFPEPPRVVRTRNRWAHSAESAAVASLAELPIRLSDALITSYDCAACGPLAEAVRYVNRPAAAFDDSIAVCPTLRRTLGARSRSAIHSRSAS
ncbi:MAG: ThiF family adenylyltransferase [Desulfobacterales bacterium]|nr:ThiF family adenylyltransferase [Desulfobacterales bacterium]